MNAARTLLASLIDYAGLFPPAELQMRAAVPRYAGYRTGKLAWMLGRFVLPLAQIDEFEHVFDDLPAKQRAAPWGLAVLSGRNLEADIKKIVEFNRRHGDEGRGDARIEAIELKVHSLDDIARAADVTTEPGEVYFEIGVAGDPRDQLAAVAAAGGRAKVRTGGVSAEMFPAVPDLARFLIAAAAAKVPFKATAGLHYPMRSVHPMTSDEKSAEVLMHGFLNVFLAAAMAWADRVKPASIEAILNEQDAAAFAFETSGVSIHGRRLTADDLTQARRCFAMSFGSCSLDQPASALKDLGLIR